MILTDHGSPSFLSHLVENEIMERRAFLISSIAAALMPETSLAETPPFLADNAQLALQSLNGARMTLGTLAPVGRAAVVHFWASWCAPCAMETRHFAGLRKMFQPERLTLLGIHVQMPGETKSKIEKFLRDTQGFVYPHVTASQDVYHLFNKSGFFERRLIALPKLYIFDRRGTIAQKHSGLAEKQLPTLDAFIAKISAA